MQKCPLCSTELKKCLINTDVAVTMCPELSCSYPFNENIETNISNVSESSLNQAAKAKVTRLQGKEAADKIFGQSST